MNTTQANDNWKQEQDAFLLEMAPESHFFRAFDGLPDVYFFAKNRRGETLFCSSNLPQNHGMSVAELIGKTDHELTPGPLAEKYLRDDAEIYRTGKPLPPQIEICLDHVGLPSWYRTCKYPIKDRQGNVIGVMGTFQPAAPDASQDPARYRLEGAVQELTRNLQQFPGIDRLADSCGVSVRQFQRVFRATFGTSAKDYWMKLRIREACALLRSSGLSLAQVAAELNFYDQSSFTKHFRRHTGQTPRAYVRQASQGITS